MTKCFAINYNDIDNRLDPEFYDPFSSWKSAIRFERYALSLIDALAKKKKMIFSLIIKSKRAIVMLNLMDMHRMGYLKLRVL